MYVRKEDEYVRFDNGSPEAIYQNTSNGNIVYGKMAAPEPVKLVIDMPEFENEETTDRIKPERMKTIFAALLATLASSGNLLVLSYVHDRVPDRSLIPPLPDIIHDLLPGRDWGIEVSEVVIISSIWTCFLMMLMHKFRWIVFRRFFIIAAIVYSLRAVTMLVTQVPVPSRELYCSPKSNRTSAVIIFERFMQLVSGFGLSINGQHTYCGDYIFSGHTLVLVLCYLTIREYSPRNCKVLHYLVWITCVTGVGMVLVARAHYAIDVFLGYYMTTRVFWMYHSLTASPEDGRPSSTSSVVRFLGRAWWYSLFKYFEENVTIAVPNEYAWPLPWPRKWTPRQA